MSDDRKAISILMVKPKAMSRADIKRAEKLGFVCVVECDEPQAARFMEPPVTMASLDQQARAALSLARWIVSIDAINKSVYTGDLVRFFVKAMLEGNRPESVPPVAKAAK